MAEKRNLLFLLLTFLITILNCQIYINEVVASNQTIIADYYGEYGDWIELYNNYDYDFDLSNYFLSDDQDELEQWQFPEITIPAQTFMLIWADNNDEIDPQGYLHTNFKIGSDESVFLSSPDTLIIDMVTLPSPPSDYSYGRESETSNEWFFFPQPTPNQPNSGGYAGFLDNPTPSHEAGFYDSSFALSFTNIEEGAVLYYTLDGSEPVIGGENTFVYNPQETLIIEDLSNQANNLSEIRTTVENDDNHWTDQWFPPAGLVKKARIIRCQVLKANHLPSDQLYLTYFVGQDFSTDFAGIPLVSLITNPSGYFDDYEGIYVPGKDENGDPITESLQAHYQENWEKHTFLQMWETDRNQGFTTQCLSEIHGSASARLMRKGLRMGFKGSLGYEDLTYDLFQDNITETYNSIILRASGQDAQHTLFRDGLGQVIFEKQGLGTSPFKPVILFINGEYWGIHNWRERSDEEYAERLYGLDVDEMDFLENSGSANPEERVGSRTRYSSILNYVKNNDLDISQNYQEITEMIDIENYINYYIAEIFVANSDWPAYNVRMWRHKTEINNPNIYFNPDANNPYEDGRFRWMIYDLDQALGRFHNYNSNTLQTAASVGSWNDNFFLLFRKLIGASDANGLTVTDNNGLYSNGSQDFRDRFVRTFCDALNTYLLPQRTNDLLLTTRDIYSPYMEEHVARWGLPEDVSDWNSYVNGLMDFLNNRPNVIRNQLANKFQLTNGSSNLTVNINNDQMGYLILNSIKIGSDEDYESAPFTGQYFNGLTLHLQAIAKPGYRFVSWAENRNTSDSLEITFTEDTSLTAIFELDDGVFQGDLMNPQAWDLNNGPYQLLDFSPETPAGQYPNNMRFLITSLVDPNIDAELTSYYSSPYNMESKSRINGLDGDGISFINTSTPAINGLETSGYMGACILALNTSGLSDIKLNYTVETMEANSRLYGLSLLYRSSINGNWLPVLANNEPITYQAGEDGHIKSYFSLQLPPDLADKPYFQLCWRYHYLSGDSGSRTMLRLDDILVYNNDLDDISNIRINEVMSDNENFEHDLAIDDLGDRSDWIELYNASSQDINLLGSYLSDDEEKYGQWLLPNLTLSPDQYLLVRASKSNRQDPNQILHTNFSLKASGEALYLTDYQGNLIDSMPEIEIAQDYSYGRLLDNPAEWSFFIIPSPASPNQIIAISAPSNVAITYQNASLTLVWDSLPNATSYKVYSADEPHAEDWYLESENILTPSYSINNLEVTSKKFYKIIALY